MTYVSWPFRDVICKRQQQNNRENGGRGECRRESGRFLSRYQRHPGAPLQREPRVRVPEGRDEEPGDPGGSREAVYSRVPGQPAGGQQRPEVSPPHQSPERNHLILILNNF